MAPEKISLLCKIHQIGIPNFKMHYTYYIVIELKCAATIPLQEILTKDPALPERSNSVSLRY